MPTAIVTGGAVRIGKALACHLAKEGWSLAIHYNTSSPEPVLNQAQKLGVACKAYQGNLMDLDFAGQFIDRVCKDFSDVELLINCAANFIQENVENTSTKTIVDTLQLNLMSPFLLMRDYKKRINRGMIINILDERIGKNIPTFAAYSVSKVGLAHVTSLAAIEWGETVRVNGIAPGLILPPAGQSEDYLTRNAKNIPTKTHGNLEDLVQGLDYLLRSPFVNGEVLFIDGGESKGRRSQE